MSETKTPYPFSHFVYFNVEEVQVLIEVLVFEQAFTNHLREKIHNIASVLTSSNTAWNSNMSHFI